MSDMPVMTGPADYSATFRKALVKKERRPIARITYCDLNWVPQEIVTGEVTADSTFSMDERGHRQVNIRLWNPDGRRTPDPTSDLWYGRFTVEWGLRTPAGDEYVDLGRFVATKPGVSVAPSAGWANLLLEGPRALWGTFNAYWVIRANDRIRDVITAIALDAGEVASNLNFINTQEIVGSEMAGHPGDDRWELAARLAGAAQEVGMILNLTYGSRQCLMYPEADPATTKSPVYSLSRGDGLLVSIDAEWDSREFANRIQVYGGSGKSATIFSEIADTSSGPYGTQRRGDWCYKWPQGQEFDPLITTQARADARRDYLFRIKRTAQQNIRLTSLVLPGLALGDVVHITEGVVSKLDANASARSYSFGLGPGGTMSLNARRVVQV